MSRRIVVEALIVVVQLRAEELWARLRGRAKPGMVVGVPSETPLVEPPAEPAPAPGPDPT
jgi:hypothetical protein